MKVLVVLDSLSFGGAENMAATLVRVATTADLQVDVVSLGPPTGSSAVWLPVLEAMGARVRFLSIPRLVHPGAVPTLARAVRQSGCDVVHAHLAYSITLATPAARLVGRRTVCTFHNLPTSHGGRDALREHLSVRVADRSAGVVCVSRASLDGFAGRYRLDPARWGVLPNGIDLSRYAPGADPLPADLGVPPGVPVVTLVAHMRPPKGQADAVQAWPQVLGQSPDARLLLVGDGPIAADLRAQARALDVQDRVVFAGLRTDVAAIVRASTLALLPTYEEALPTALIEAAACGVPAVSTRVGGVPEVVDEGTTGLLVAPGDPGALASAVLELLSDPDRRRQMGLAARARAEEHFDADRWVRGLRSTYEDAVAGRPFALARSGSSSQARVTRP